MDRAAQLQRSLYGFALVVAPILLGLGTFFWNGTEVGLTGGAIQVLASTLLIPALLGLLALLRPAMPRLAVLWIPFAIYAGVGGNNWGMDGIFAAVYGADAAAHEAAMNAMGPAAAVSLFLPGLLFPATLVLLGAAHLRAKTIPSWCALLLIIGGIAFPASRIPRIELLAHLADLLILIPTMWVGLQLLRSESALATSPAMAEARA